MFKFDYFTEDKWGRSSVGRALEWHSRGRQFDPDRLHNYNKTTLFLRLFYFDQLIV